MRNSTDFAQSFANHLAGTTHQVVELFAITATGMTNQYFTDSNVNVSFSGQTHTPYPLKRSKMSFSTDLKPNEVELTMAFNSDLREALRKGILKSATVTITRVNLDSPSTDNLLLFDGEVGTVDVDEDILVLRSVNLDFLSQEIPKREYQVACNWKLYDEFCTVGLTQGAGPAGATTGGWQETGTFSSTSTDRKTLVSTTFGGRANNYFLLGYVKATSGLNEFVHRHVTSHAGNTITVTPPFPYNIAAGDSFEAAPGCSHDITDCEDKFNNLVNYGGFPYIPTSDVVL